jgi:GAF domain-containing protein
MEIDDLIARLTTMAAGGDGLERSSKPRSRACADDPRFDWTGVYELFSDDVLRLGPFVGAPTDHVFIGVGNGVCGTAVAERRNMNIPDVREITNYLACSVSTRSSSWC